MPVADVPELCHALEMTRGETTEAAIICERRIDGESPRLEHCLGQQPAWSDIPVLLLAAPDADRGTDAERDRLERLGNVIVLQRPLRATLVESAVRSALRGRARQYEARRHLADLARARAELETRVGERTTELRRSQARLRAAFETSLQIQGLLEPDGTLLDANATALAVIGETLDQVVGRKLWDTPFFNGSPAMQDFARGAVACAAAGQELRREITMPVARGDVPSGTRAFDFSLRPVRDETGAIVALLPEANEVTDRRLAEDALRQAQKMEAIGALTGGVAHDFNNLLTVIMGSMSFLQRRLADDPKLLRLVDGAMSASQRGAKLTHQLLAFSRKQPLQASDLDANEVVRGISDLLASTAGSDVALAVALDAEALPVRADRNQLEMALLNLVVNARDASERGAAVTVTTGRSLARIDGRAPVRVVSLTVRDAGAGMTPEVRDRCFEPFFTTKAAGVGTGLGLSMVYGFIRQSGGDVAIRSAPGEGTEIRLLLPERVAEAAPAPDAAVELKPARGERILLVEDDADVRALAGMALRQLGYAVIEAASGEAGLALLEGDAGVDLLFSDVVMPGAMDGLALAAAARRLRPGLRMLLTSARLPQGSGLEEHLGLQDGFLAKPYRPADLALAVQDVFER